MQRFTRKARSDFPMTLKRSHGVGRNAVDLLSHPPAENLHEVPFRDDLVLACAGG